MSDFSREVVVKFSGGKMSEEDRNKIRVFIELVGKSSIKRCWIVPVKAAIIE